jgi:RimJ/RimL family protein N-acetyltransferase
LSQRINDHGDPVGTPLDHWQPREMPPRTPLRGAWCDVVPLDPGDHAADLHAANGMDREHRIWTYLAYGPFDSEPDYRAWMQATCLGADPMFFAVVDRRSGRAAGVASLMRIDPQNGVIEVGHINFSPVMQQSPAGTEAMYLLASRVFDELGYRRYEWKCDSLNRRSGAAALRLGFRYEGTFRQASVYKGRNRDTAWYSMLDSEWPAVRRAFEAWLDPANFDADGRQRQGLAGIRERFTKA